ncbi:MAG: patatin-like phospholipase family protein [Planctomycetaceae bacterium]|nr:patatin-like phospholipase family protein [Planctomycetaceae bacterium]
MAGGNSIEGPKSFEIGLVMAGSISAGAYIAGVIDFLIQALDEWERARGGSDPDCPRHNVSLKVMAGASGGGITAAIAAAQLGRDFSPVTNLPNPGPVNNKFFESWVERIDITGLLGTRDLDADPEADVYSALDSTVLDEIAASAFDFPAGTPPVTRKYLANPLHVLVTLTNLRGVPYRIHFQGERNHLPNLSMHEDYMRFAVGDETAGLEREVVRLPPGKFDDPNWKMLATAALATSAFPVGLAPRRLSRLATDYLNRKWLVLKPVEADGHIISCGDFEQITPEFPDEIGNEPGFQYDFLCVDGGAVDNEPLEKARRILEGDRLSSSSESQGDRANQALLAIAPFPDLGSYPVQEPPVGNPFLLHVIQKTIYGGIQQARFQPDQLKKCRDTNIFNRYLIAPNREPVPGAKIQSIIASASVGGFGGFLALAFRVHDYQLGRLNCQEFLRSTFALPYDEARNIKNPLFDVGWTESARKLYRIVEGPDGQNRQPRTEPVPGDKVFLPIIPLMGTATDPVKLLDWPSYSQGELDVLRGQVATRLEAVVKRLIDRNVSNPLARIGLRDAFKLFRGHLVDKIVQNIADDLRDRKLLE